MVILLQATVGVQDNHHEVAAEMWWRVGLTQLRQCKLQVPIFPINEQLEKATRVSTDLSQVMHVSAPCQLLQVCSNFMVLLTARPINMITGISNDQDVP